MTKRVLLLDYDGVILRNTTANNLIAKHAGIYTRNVTSKHNGYTVSLKDSQELCFNLYKGFGHTLLGIQAVAIDKPSVSLKKYNSFVYSHIDYDNVISTNNDMKDVESVLDLCHHNNIETYVFSNSPKDWIKQTLKRNHNINKQIIDIRDVLGVRDDDELLLKPLPKIYDLIDECFVDKEIVFVDDSACNLQYSLTKSNWVNVLYCGVNCNTSKNMHLINNLSKLEEILVVQ